MIVAEYDFVAEHHVASKSTFGGLRMQIQRKDI